MPPARSKPSSSSGGRLQWDPRLEEHIKFLASSPGAADLVEAMLVQMNRYAWTLVVNAQTSEELFQAQGFCRAVDGMKNRLCRYRNVAKTAGLSHEITVT